MVFGSIIISSKTRTSSYFEETRLPFAKNFMLTKQFQLTFFSQQRQEAAGYITNLILFEPSLHIQFESQSLKKTNNDGKKHERRQNFH